MKKTLSILSRVLSLCVLLFFVFAVILYRQGYYDVSFLPRGDGDAPSEKAETAAETTDTPETAPVTEQTEETSAPPETAKAEETTASSGAEKPSADPLAAFRASLSSSKELRKKGWAPTDETYDPSSQKLSKMELPSKIARNRMLTYRTRSSVTSVWNDSAEKLQNTTEEIDRPVLELYMGMLFYDDGTNVALLDDSGQIVMVNFDGISFAYERDAYDRPLFLYNGVYYYVSDDYRLTYSSFNPAFGSPVRADTPVGWNYPTHGLYRYYVEKTVEYISNYKYVYRKRMQFGEDAEETYAEEKVKLYGFLDASGEVVIEAQYYYASNFDENGLAVVADRDRVVRFIDTRGKEVINPYGTITRSADRNNRSAIEGYYLPDSDGVSSVGYYFFDHGLTRVRRVARDYFDISAIVEDEELLMTADGKLFDMPAGYALTAYSDGVLILERDGRYGCLDYTGRWIAQPVYTAASAFSEGLCALCDADGHYGMIDAQGNTVVPFAYDYISSASGGRICAYQKSSGWEVFEKLAK